MVFGASRMDSEGWCDIFRKDRATGENATGFVDAVNGVFNIPSSSTTPNAPRRSETNNNTSPPEVHMQEESNVHVGESNLHVDREKRSRKKKKKVVEEDDQFLGMLPSFCKVTATNKSNMLVRVGHAHDATERRGKVYDVLKNMPNLTMEERLLATKYLCNKTEDLDMFFSLDDEVQVKMVQIIIEKMS
ncbi:Unknown protein [Striga hermonthica]|uniref:Uncharacterized protein n=1 Tax=Striga hermonthica TaxID=68872 RepID=A0A9N7MYI2_STRHE|nr:Unknown protein [Striga hermonthica]